MPRNIDDVANSGGGGAYNQDDWPDAGKHLAECVDALTKTAGTGTRMIELTWRTEDGCQFEDALFLTARALPRLALVASRVCGESGELSDDDEEALETLADIVAATVVGKWAVATIETHTKPYTPTRGPRAGERIMQTLKRVAFSGYEAADAHAHAPPPDERTPDETRSDVDDAQPGDGEDNLPF